MTWPKKVHPVLKGPLIEPPKKIQPTRGVKLAHGSRSEVRRSIPWPTKRIKTKSNRAKRSRKSSITTLATCPERQSAPAKMSLGNPTLIGYMTVTNIKTKTKKSAIIVECVDDNEGVDKAMQLAKDLDLEIWDHRRRVARTPSIQPKA